MKKQSSNISRRSILKGIVSIPVVAIAGFQSTTYAAMVTLDDPTAMALAYTDKSTTAGKTCANCSLYSGTGGESGPCAIFPGKEVAAAGWCKSWAARP